MLFVSGTAAAQNIVTIDVATVENQINGSIYGACIEDVNHEIYGGLYDQKIFGESFEEDYQNITFNDFDTYGGNWSGASSKQVSAEANDGAKLLYNTPLTDGSVEVELKFSDPCESAALIVRTTNAQTGADNFDGYEIGLNALTHEIILGKHVHNWQPIGNTPATFSPDEWTKLRVELAGARIRIYVNDATTPNVDYTDANSPLLSGKIGIRTWRSNVSFRNLCIKTGEQWENLSFDGEVTQSGMWDIFRESNTAQFSLDTENAFNGKQAQKIVYTGGSGKAGLINGGLNRWGIAVQNGKTQELENTGTSWIKFPFSFTIIRIEAIKTAVKEINTKKINVYRQGDDFILTYLENIKSITLYDISGRQFANMTAKPYIYTFSTAGMADGCYIFQFSGEEKESVKVMK